MKKIALLLLVPLFSYGQLPFEGTSHNAFLATVEEGRLLTKSDDEKSIRLEVIHQLHYMVGQYFTAMTPALNSTLKLDRVSVDSSGELRKVNYRATFLVAFRKNHPIPQTLPAVFPLRADDDGLEAFGEKYSATCGGERAPTPLWYGFNPKLETCALKDKPLAEDAIEMEIAFKALPSTEKKRPEYERVWEDGLLHVTAAFGNLNNYDPILNVTNSLKSTYGEPLENTTKTGENYKYTQLLFKVDEQRKIRLDLFYFTEGNIQSAPADFVEAFQAATVTSDLIAYNGHAGYGKNARKFTNLIRFEADRYYLVWLNACKPFLHTDTVMWDQIRELNDTETPSKYLDFLTSGDIGYFADGSDIIFLVNSLVQQKESFSQIMGKSYDLVVVGEEDNPEIP